ncbi:MAG TPA: hypothetical protein VFJ58_30245 [Armatimonadota bacterium]|nr:hypothetical protein [Armatimonadota bacterium]
MRYKRFDRSRLKLLPLAERMHDMNLSGVLDPAVYHSSYESARLAAVAERIQSARRVGRPVIFMMGAHVIKQGLSRYLIRMMEQGWITHLAMNGACVIHDYELACIGATTESVSRYISEGQFGLWNETGEINAIVNAAPGMGFGEAMGAALQERNPPNLDVSILAAAYRLNIPLSVHVGIGQDIIHEHPGFDGAAVGRASYEDFLIFTESVSALDGGVYLNVGSAVMGPEVYLKALAMARNVARQEGRTIRRFTTAVFDLIDLGDELSHEAAKTDPRYYYRPFKTILVRTVQDGGESFYIRGDHRETLPKLYELLPSTP